MKTIIPTIKIVPNAASAAAINQPEPELIAETPRSESNLRSTTVQAPFLTALQVNPETTHQPFGAPLIQDSKLEATSQFAPVALPSRFILNRKYLTSVKDQGSCGSCWAFGTYGSLESSILIDGGSTEDFSENNLKNYHGFDWGPCAGGNHNLSIAYLSRGNGPVKEVDDPYHDWDNRPSPGGAVPYSLGEALFFDSDQEIKNALTNSGALYSTMRWDSTYFDSTNNNYYYNGFQRSNHGITIVGWDDSRNISNAPQDGAWLIKNSWGTGFGDDGYFWLSYDDTRGANWAVSFKDAVSPNPQDRAYVHDQFGQVTSVNTPYAVNSFTAKGNETLTTIGFFTQADGASYDLRIYDDFSGGVLSNLLSVKGDTVQYAGYHTVDLAHQVPLTAGDDFHVYLHLTDGGDYPHALDYRYPGYSSNSTASPGESYYSFNGTTWTDINTWNNTANFAIKAFTQFSQEDNYEQNDHQGNAFNLTSHEQQWLNEIDGKAITNDDDWYRVEVLPGDTHLDIDVKFIHDDGNINIRAYNENGQQVARSTSITSDEHIDVDLSPGTYYLNAYPYPSSNSGNSYDLRWESVTKEDAYERLYSNDTPEYAYSLRWYEKVWLSDFAGEGISNDHDFYKVNVDQPRLIVDSQFSHNKGDIDVVVYDSNGNWVDTSISTTDNEFIDVEVSPGTYYLDVSTWSESTPGNSYDLRWLDHNPYGTAGADTIDGTDYKDTLYGYGGNDRLSGQEDQDELYGGDGRDSLYGNSGDDSLWGEAGVDFLYGGGGRDILQGGKHNDRLYGQGGDDNLFGGTGNDVLVGGNGNDTLTGVATHTARKREIDHLRGNAGADLFVLGDDSQVYYKGIGFARILDFTLSQKDAIQLYDNSALYQLEESFGNTRIELLSGDLIGLVKGVTGLDLDNFYFQFV